jgi:hypothetical protein
MAPQTRITILKEIFSVTSAHRALLADGSVELHTVDAFDLFRQRCVT